MFAALLIALVQATAPADAPEAPAAEQVDTSRMTCEPFDRRTRTQMCTTAGGEVLRCRRERTLGSRFPSTVCLSYREDQQLEEDSRRNLDRQQRLWDNQAG